jgi:ribosome-associated protein
VSLEIAHLAAEIARDKKADKLSLFDLRGKSDICNYHFICSAESDRQTRAIADAIAEACKSRLGIRPACTEGMDTGTWVLLDYGSIIVHVFQEGTRTYFDLEKLWAGREVSLEAAESSPA